MGLYGVLSYGADRNLKLLAGQGSAGPLTYRKITLSLAALVVVRLF